MAYTVQKIVVGDTIEFVVHWEKDGEIWDISGGSATLFISDPDGNVETLVATISDGTNGIANYVYTAFDQVGTWKRQWKTVKSGITLYTQEIEFEVLPALG